MKVAYLLVLLVLNHYIFCGQSANCDGEIIEHCLECDPKDNYESCLKCEENHFLFFNNLLCLPCNHSIYGQIGCEGNCDGSNYRNTRMAFCEEGKCKEGYYNLNGICFPCNDGSTACAKCTYEVKENHTELDFICHECINNEYNLTEFGICQHCYLSHCEICHYSNNFTKEVCDHCFDGFYINSDGKCEKCKDICIPYGCCRSCSDNDDDENKICSCWPHYHLVNKDTCQKNEQPSHPYNPGHPYTSSEVETSIVQKVCSPGCAYCENEKCYSCCDNYTFIQEKNNDCLLNNETSQPYLYGCVKAIPINKINGIYKCLKCYYTFTKIINEDTCRKLSEIGLSQYCLEVENLKDIKEPLYSCHKCNSNNVIINETSRGIINCALREGKLIFCEEATEDKDGNYKCTKCVENASLNSSDICVCNSDSFGKFDELCFKCDDDIYGNPGCSAEKGCNYSHSNDELDCNECKEGFFEYTRGQCFSCQNEIRNCDKCHYDQSNKLLQCDNCISIYSPNKAKNKCEIDECKEYPEIYPGCIICKDKLDKFKSEKKCQACKYGYFKTEDEKCVYCRSEKYGGPACYECQYDDKKNIICKDCLRDEDDSYNTAIAVSSSGQHYHCKYDLSDACIKCVFIKIQGAEKLTCLECDNGYYLNSDGKCISYIYKLDIIPNCLIHNFEIEGSIFSFYFYNDMIYFTKNETNENDNTVINEALKNYKDKISTTCQQCERNYIMKDKRKCEIFDFNECIGKNLITNSNVTEEMSICLNLSYQYGYPLIYIGLINNNIDNKIINISDYSEIESVINLLYNIIDTSSSKFYEFNEETKNYILNSQIFYKTSDNAIKFKGCNGVIFLQAINSYQCFNCKNGYILDNKTHICRQIYNDNLISNIDYYHIDNNDEDTNEKNYSDYYYYEGKTLVTFENKEKVYIKDALLENCIEANASSFFLNIEYNCTLCDYNYISYFSKFYQKYICQNIYENITKIKDIELEFYEEEESISVNEEGICKENYFTPDGKKCYPCDNKNVGMLGCEGKCSFSLKRNKAILCESECKKGYIESSEGICESCDSINKGCDTCSYNNTYPNNYIGIKKARRFQCDHCMDGYIASSEGKCLTCEDLNIHNCKKCSQDKETGNYVCNECSEHYILNDEGECNLCILTEEVINNKCINCGDSSQGGIDNCILCQKNNETNGILCKQCSKGYILNKDKNICLPLNDAFSHFDTCLELTEKDSKYVCNRCKPEYTLLKGEKEIESKCIYTPTLYDSNLYNYLYYGRNCSINFDYFERDISGNDILSNQLNFTPCKISINLGNKDNPSYSCEKCYNIFEDEEYDIFYHYYYDYYLYDDYYFYFDSDLELYLPVKINDLDMKYSYCIKSNEDLKGCIEADYKVVEGKKIYSCTKCIKSYYLKYNKDLDINYCTYNDSNVGRCLVKFCKQCASNNNYFCSSCINSDYEVNQFSGACIAKTDIVPSVTWKDIFRLQLNGVKEINGRVIEGPSFTLRGITSNTINSRHAFLVYITFKIKHGLRNLQDEIKMPAICEIEDETEESIDNVNIVDYNCIGNSKIEPDNNNIYTLARIEEDPANENYIHGSNMEEINEIILSTNISKKMKSNYKLQNADNAIIFNAENITILSKKSFNINGMLTRKINPKSQLSKKSILFRNLKIQNYENIHLEMNISPEKSNCNFSTDDENLNSNLTCSVEFKKGTNISNLMIKNYEIKVGNENVYISNLGNKIIKLDEYDDSKRLMKKDNNSSKTGIIVICVIAGVIVLAAIIFVLIYILKIKKRKNVNISNNEINNQQINDSYKSNINLDKA